MKSFKDLVLYVFNNNKYEGKDIHYFRFLAYFWETCWKQLVFVNVESCRLVFQIYFHFAPETVFLRMRRDGESEVMKPEGCTIVSAGTHASNFNFPDD